MIYTDNVLILKADEVQYLIYFGLVIFSIQSCLLEHKLQVVFCILMQLALWSATGYSVGPAKRFARLYSNEVLVTFRDERSFLACFTA